MYIVAEQWTDKETQEPSLFGERFFNTAEQAIAYYQDRLGQSSRKLLILKALPVKVVLVDFDAAGLTEVPIDR